MKAFVSGQLGEKQTVRSLYKRLESLGLEITHDWTRTDNILDKMGNKDECGIRAEKDITGVVDCDVYILLANNKKMGKGMYAELGAALALKEVTGKPDIYIIGPVNYLSIFYLHPSVQTFESIDEFLEALSKKVKPSVSNCELLLA